MIQILILIIIAVKNTNEVIVIGLDGATFDLLLPLINDGHLPHIRNLINNGVWGELESTIPMFTPTAWSSFMTGKNPGKHGVLGFFQTNFENYSLSLLNPHKKRGKALWDILSDNGFESIVVNVPTTYPPKPLNGILISGMMTPPGSNYTYPNELQNEINEVMDYKIYPSETYNEGEENEFYKEVIKITETRYKLFEYLLQNKKWNFAVIVFTGGDMLQHALWKKSLNKCGEKNKIYLYYKKIDSIIGDLVENHENTKIIIMSDHGFGELNKFININSWLLKKGYIKIKKSPINYLKLFFYKFNATPENIYKIISRLKILNIRNKVGRNNTHRLLSSLFLSFKDVDWKNTKAYSIGSMGQIFINRVGRESQGIINEEELGDLINEIKNKLEKINNGGKPVFNRILVKEEIYHGKYFEEMPEIILYPTEGYIGFEEFEFMSNKVISNTKNIEGTHRLNGIFIGYPTKTKISPLKNLKIYDIMPTILEIFGITVSDDVDGCVIKEMMVDENP